MYDYPDNCPGCDSLERALDRECAMYEKQIDILEQKLDDALQENIDLRAELNELQYRMDGLEK